MLSMICSQGCKSWSLGAVAGPGPLGGVALSLAISDCILGVLKCLSVCLCSCVVIVVLVVLWHFILVFIVGPVSGPGHPN